MLAKTWDGVGHRGCKSGQASVGLREVTILCLPLCQYFRIEPRAWCYYPLCVCTRVYTRAG